MRQILWQKSKIPNSQWRWMPNDLPPWAAVYQQTRRWMAAGCLEALVADVQSILREWAGRKGEPTAVCLDSRTLQWTSESGARAGYDVARRRKGSKVHLAVDTLGHLFALTVTAADEGDRTQLAALAEEVQQVTGNTVEVAYVDQGYTGPHAAEAAGQHGIKLEGSSTRWPNEVSCCCPNACRRTKLRLGSPLPQARTRIRTTRHHPQRTPLRRFAILSCAQDSSKPHYSFITAARRNAAFPYPQSRACRCRAGGSWRARG